MQRVQVVSKTTVVAVVLLLLEMENMLAVVHLVLRMDETSLSLTGEMFQYVKKVSESQCDTLPSRNRPLGFYIISKCSMFV